MEANKEVIEVFNKYRGHVGATQTDTAASLTLAHYLDLVLKKLESIYIAKTLTTIEKVSDDSAKAN